MKDCLLSIIIPIYQVEDYIADCLYSICRQNLKDYSWFEVVCVNDGTKDKSMDVVRRIVCEYPNLRFKVIDKKNEGVSVARNVGYINADGRYLWFVDSDDVILDGALELFYQEISLDCYDLVIGQYNKSSKIDINQSVFRGGNKRHVAFYSSCIRRQLLDENNIQFVEGVAYGEDLLFFETAQFLAKSQKKMPNVVYVYRQRVGSAMNSNSEIQELKYIESLERRLELYSELDLKYCSTISLEDKFRKKYFLNLRDAVVRNILLFHLRYNKKEPWELLQELKEKGVYPYRLRWNDLCEFYAISDYIIKLFCFLFPFSWYYRFVAKCYSLFVRL